MSGLRWLVDSDNAVARPLGAVCGKGALLYQFQEFFFCESGLLYDCQECSFLDCFVARNRDFVFPISKVDVASFLVNDLEPCFAKGFQKFTVRERWKFFRQLFAPALVYA